MATKKAPAKKRPQVSETSGRRKATSSRMESVDKRTAIVPERYGKKTRVVISKSAKNRKMEDMLTKDIEELKFKRNVAKGKVDKKLGKDTLARPPRKRSSSKKK